MRKATIIIYAETLEFYSQGRGFVIIKFRKVFVGIPNGQSFYGICMNDNKGADQGIRTNRDVSFWYRNEIFTLITGLALKFFQFRKVFLWNIQNSFHSDIN